MGKRVADIPDDEPLFDLTHLDNAWRPVNTALVLALAASAAVCLWLYFVVHGDELSDAALVSFCQLYLVVSVVCVLGKVMRRRPHNWLSPDVVFWLVFTMFHVSSVALYLLGQIDSPRRAFQFAEGVNKAMCCVVLFAIAFFLGYELGPLGRQQPAYFAPARRLPASVFRAVQLVSLMVASVAAVVVILGIGKLLIMHGYTGFRRLERHGVETGTQRFISLSLGVLRIMITLYVAACITRHRKVLEGAFLPALVIGSILFFAVLGARTEVAVAGLPLLLGYHFFVRRLRLWLGVPMLLVVLLGFGILGVGRRAESLSPTAVARAYREFRQDTGISPFVITLAEAGGSFSTVVTACAFVPSHEPFWRGRSFFESLLMIIPNPVVGLRGMTASPSAWATYRMTGRRGGEQAGAGSSMAMEAYLNFGMAGGAAFMAAMGYLYRRVYDTMLRRPTFLRICLLLITVTCLGLWCRNYSHGFLRPVGWTMIAAWLLWTGCGGAGARVQQAAVRRTTV